MYVPGFALPDNLASVPTPAANPSAPAPTLAASTGLHLRNIRKPQVYGISEAHRKRLALIQRIEKREAKKAGVNQSATGSAGTTAASAAAAAAADDENGGDGTTAQPAKKRKRNPTEDTSQQGQM